MKYLTDFFLPSLAALVLMLVAAYAAYTLGYAEGAHREHARAVLASDRIRDDEQTACYHELNDSNASCYDRVWHCESRLFDRDGGR